MSCFVNHYEFDKIEALTSKSGAYIITGEEEKGQLKLADILVRQAYVQMNMKEMETVSLTEDIEKCLIKKDCDIILDNVSIEYVKKYLFSINQLAKIYNSRVFLCSNDKEIKPDEMLKDVCGVIQMFLCPYTGLVELNVVTKENKRCIIDSPHGCQNSVQMVILMLNQLCHVIVHVHLLLLPIFIQITQDTMAVPFYTNQ